MRSTADAAELVPEDLWAVSKQAGKGVCGVMIEGGREATSTDDGKLCGGTWPHCPLGSIAEVD